MLDQPLAQDDRKSPPRTDGDISAPLLIVASVYHAPGINAEQRYVSGCSESCEPVVRNGPTGCDLDCQTTTADLDQQIHFVGAGAEEMQPGQSTLMGDAFAGFRNDQVFEQSTAQRRGRQMSRIGTADQMCRHTSTGGVTNRLRSSHPDSGQHPMTIPQP